MIPTGLDPDHVVGALRRLLDDPEVGTSVTLDDLDVALTVRRLAEDRLPGRTIHLYSYGNRHRVVVG